MLDVSPTSDRKQITLDPARILPAVVRADVYQGRNSFTFKDKQINAYLLDLERRSIRHVYYSEGVAECLKTLRRRCPGHAKLLEQRAIGLSENLEVDRRTAAARFLTIEVLQKAAFHNALDEFFRQLALREKRIKGWGRAYGVHNTKYSIGEALENASSEARHAWRAFQTTYVAQHVEAALQKNGYKACWAIEPSAGHLPESVFKKNTGARLEEIIRAEFEDELRDSLQVGQELIGAVKTISDDFAILDLGGKTEAILLRTNMSWRSIRHPSDLVQVDQQLTVKILGIDWARTWVDVGLKQLQPSPWDDVEKNHPVGSRARGKVTSVQRYGAFVELEDGIEGLIPLTHLPAGVRLRADFLKEGGAVEVVVMSVDRAAQKILLSMRETPGLTGGR